MARKPRIPANLRHAFEDGAVLDTYKGQVRVELRRAGDLILPTGRLIVSDPIYVAEGPLKSPQLTPGSYPVELVVVRYSDSDGHYVACARVCLSNGPVADFQFAVPRSCGVDNAMVAFADGLIAEKLNALDSDDEYQSRLDSLVDDIGKSEAVFANVLVDSATQANLIAWDVIGDGVYPVYCGRDSRGQLCSVVVDFALLDSEEEVAIQSRIPWWQFWR